MFLRGKVEENLDFEGAFGVSGATHKCGDTEQGRENLSSPVGKVKAGCDFINAQSWVGRGLAP
jgi:hypothetical protein